MAVPAKSVEQFFELMQRFVRVRPRFVAPEPLAQFKRDVERLPGGAGKPSDRTAVYRALIVLAQAEGSPSMSELSASLGVPLSTATRTVDWLVARGVVSRAADPKDRRTVRLLMTPKGARIFQAFAEFNRQRIARLLRAFSPAEQAQLLKLMNRLLDSFQAEGPE